MQQRGADAKARIDNNIFACQRINVRVNQPLLNTSNTEGVPGDEDIAFLTEPGCTSKLPDLPDGEVELVNATFDDSSNPFATPILLAPGFFYDVVVYPAGVDGPKYGPWHCAFAGSEHTFVVPGAQPLSIRFQTDGVGPAFLICE